MSTGTSLEEQRGKQREERSKSPLCNGVGVINICVGRVVVVPLRGGAYWEVVRRDLSRGTLRRELLPVQEIFWFSGF